MRSLIACGALAVAASLTACSAGPGPEPCSGARPGVELTLVFEPGSGAGPPSWTGEGLLVLNQTNDPQGQTQVEVAPAALDAEGKATVVAAYPPQAESGFFFAKFTAAGASPHGDSWEGWASFQADPGTCHRVELDVKFVNAGANDGGVPPDAAP